MRPDNQVIKRKKKQEKRELGVLNKTSICWKFEYSGITICFPSKMLEIIKPPCR